MRKVIKAVNDDTEIKVYRGKRLITKGNWYQDNILDFIHEEKVKADLDGTTNICKVVL